MDVWDGANCPMMQDVFRHFQLSGLTIGNRMHICSQVAREIEVVELWDFNESRHEARHQAILAQNFNNASSSGILPILLDTHSKSN
jgi:hypothetical protein